MIISDGYDIVFQDGETSSCSCGFCRMREEGSGQTLLRLMCTDHKRIFIRKEQGNVDKWEELKDEQATRCIRAHFHEAVVRRALPKN